MSRHESVSCDSCMKANFKGRRFKCLVCYDYDLCSTCFEASVTTARHTSDHPMQCILTRTEFELFYGGENAASDHPQSYTCPYCGKMGFTEITLQEHASAQHVDVSSEVICPICASSPGGEPNHVTDDLSGHLAVEHRGRDLFEEPALRSHRRIANSARRGSRARNFTSNPPPNNASALLRESIDPIAELLSHLSGVGRHNVRATPQQFRELQMQIEAERAIRLPPEVMSYREHLQQRMPRHRMSEPSSVTAASSAAAPADSKSTGNAPATSTAAATASLSTSKFLLTSHLEPSKLSGAPLEALEEELADHSLFIQELLLSTLAQNLSLDRRESYSEGDRSHDSAKNVDRELS